MNEICPNCNKLCIISEHICWCPRCGYTFTKHMNIKHDDDIGIRRSTENVDRD